MITCEDFSRARKEDPKRNIEPSIVVLFKRIYFCWFEWHFTKPWRKQPDIFFFLLKLPLGMFSSKVCSYSRAKVTLPNHDDSCAFHSKHVSLSLDSSQHWVGWCVGDFCLPFVLSWNFLSTFLEYCELWFCLGYKLFIEGLLRNGQSVVKGKVTFIPSSWSFKRSVSFRDIYFCTI